jgi:pyruvate/2-oxoglutarate dehydrogenase complex dihydrolipoamide acyltransferase (E2) component
MKKSDLMHAYHLMRLARGFEARVAEVLDGAAAAKFLRDLKALLENPENLLEGPGA